MKSENPQMVIKLPIGHFEFGFGDFKISDWVFKSSYVLYRSYNFLRVVVLPGEGVGLDPINFRFTRRKCLK